MSQLMISNVFNKFFVEEIFEGEKIDDTVNSENEWERSSDGAKNFGERIHSDVYYIHSLILKVIMKPNADSIEESGLKKEFIHVMVSLIAATSFRVIFKKLIFVFKIIVEVSENVCLV